MFLFNCNSKIKNLPFNFHDLKKNQMIKQQHTGVQLATQLTNEVLYNIWQTWLVNVYADTYIKA